ncbi:MAG TPA: AI-2E family transporter [Candidatus Methylacidiphilales bacterium]
MNRALASGPLVWLGIILTTCLLLLIFQTALWLVMPVLLAIVFYYIMSPWVNLAMSRGLTRARAVFIVTMMLCMILVAVGTIVAPKISMAAHNWRNSLPLYIQDGTNLVAKAQASLAEFFPFLHRPGPNSGAPKDKIGTVIVQENRIITDDKSKESDADTQALNDKVAAFSDKYSGDIALELLHWIPSLLLVPYLTYFFLLDGPRFKRFLVRAIPNAFFEKTLYLFYRIEDQMRRYFQGLLALTALDAVSLGVGLWILGVNTPFFLATIAAVLSWLPYLGSIAGCLMVVLVTAHDAPNSPWLPYEAVGLFILVRLLDDFVFLPLTVGRSLRMHPLVTVLMILLGGAVAGISGLLLVMPVLGVVMVAGQIVGELLTDERVLARHRHARELRRLRARVDLYAEK